MDRKPLVSEDSSRWSLFVTDGPAPYFPHIPAQNSPGQIFEGLARNNLKDRHRGGGIGAAQDPCRWRQETGQRSRPQNTNGHHGKRRSQVASRRHDPVAIIQERDRFPKRKLHARTQGQEDPFAGSDLELVNFPAIFLGESIAHLNWRFAGTGPESSLSLPFAIP